MDDLESRQAGLNGQAMPVGGNMNEWQAGRSIRTWNENQLAAQNAPVSIPSYAPIVPAPVSSASPWGAGSRMVSFKGIDPILGLLLLIFVGAPFYYLTIPLWLALYPAAGSASVLVYIGAFMYFAGDSLFTDSGHFAFPFFLAFVAAWPLTLVDQMYARGHPVYWRLRHVLRIALVGLWAIYALSDYAVFANHVHMKNPQLPPLQWTSRNILLAVCAMVAMHVWLSPKGGLRRIWNRLRGGGQAGFQRVN
jgi:hypothetical protein